MGTTWRAAAVAAALTTLCLACTAAAAARQTSDSRTPAALVVSAVDGAYLYADSPGWRAARAELLRDTRVASADEYARIDRILTGVKDSELHLIDAAQLAAINDEGAATAPGFGLLDFGIDWDPSSGAPRVVTPRVGSPAAQAGIEPHDLLVAIGGRSTKGMTHEEVLDAIRKAPEGPLVIEVRRGSRDRQVRLLRATPMPAVTAEMKRAGSERIGYVRIAQFTPTTGELTRHAVLQFEQQSPIGYVLDLRNNLGGFVGEAAKVAGLFKQGKLALKVRRDGKTEPIESDSPLATTKPLVILINGGTASAAELVAAVLQEGHRAVLVGSESYGRGQAQVYMPLGGGSGISIPSALLETTGGHGFKGHGITPDVVVEAGMLPVNRLATGHDRQFQKAVRQLQLLARR